jgi:L-rhamnose mutarotase
MHLKPGNQQEYIRRHDQIWPEISKLLKKAGIFDYFIFLDQETDTLFAIQKISGESDSQQLGDIKIMKKWWEYMSDIMVTNPDYSPVSIPLKQVYHLD